MLACSHKTAGRSEIEGSVNFKKIFSSPITYVAAGYLAAEMCQKASDAVTAGRLIPGTIQSDALGMVLIPMMAIGPITGVSLAVWHSIHRVRLMESILT